MAKLTLLWALLLSVSLLVKGDVTLIQTVCRETSDFDLCFKTLKSDPRSDSADRKGLVAIMIDIDSQTSTSITSYVSDSIKSAGDESTKKALSDCLDAYGSAKDHFGDATDDLNSGDYGGANVQVSASLDAPSDCQSGFGDEKVEYPTELAQRGESFRKLCSLTLAMINHIG
ncbi:Cell wall / vacuolar inhibitor of fructosidase 2 [Acorus calamus]|uniref:Cell wall / vacuolar inhibitor of fructosidase 2 n=1 Tax=Acorus calamus TaxID=4465 RepID=A0AAV9DFN4_ACOCL|nr:Cell wall / vacuolar inhibitor of fructosidase 2 [Acorus calamus]